MNIGIVKQPYVRSAHAPQSTLRKKALYVTVAATLAYLLVSSNSFSVHLGTEVNDGPEISQTSQTSQAESITPQEYNSPRRFGAAVADPVRQWYKSQTAALTHAWGRLNMNSMCESALLSHVDELARASPTAATAIASPAVEEHPLGPLDRFMCLGEELTTGAPEGVDTGLYTRPFRFHVYKDMPTHLLNDTYHGATKFFSQKESALSQFLTERQIIESLHLHPCHTDDELEADAFIIPAQTVSATWLSREGDAKGPNGESAWGDEGRAYRKAVESWLQDKLGGPRFAGRDHYAVSIPWWARERPWSSHIGLIGVEVPTMFDTQQHFDDRLYAASVTDITIPYPDPDAQAYYSEERLKEITKDLTAVFVGQMPQNGPVRRFVRDHFIKYNIREGREMAVWSDLQDREDIRSLKNLLARATFGPVMPGDSFTSRRLFSLLFAGTIPVIICDRCILPYADMINYRKFAIFIPEQRVMTDPDFDIFNDVLLKLSPEQIASYRHYGHVVRKHFTYHDEKPLPGDAFDLLVREMALTHYRNRGTKDMMLRAIGAEQHSGQSSYPQAQFMAAELLTVTETDDLQDIKEDAEMNASPAQHQNIPHVVAGQSDNSKSNADSDSNNVRQAAGPRRMKRRL